MYILAISDERHRALYDSFDPQRWKDIDLVLSCGDLDAKYLSYIVTVFNVPLLYVPGNHDQSYLNNPPEGCDSIDGRAIDIKGVTIGGLGGSNWYNGKEFQYTEKQMSRRAKKITRQAKKLAALDILVTHAPPKGIHDLKDQCHTGFSAFRDLMKNLKPKFLVHGHNHEIYKKEDRDVMVDGVRVINCHGYYKFVIDK